MEHFKKIMRVITSTILIFVIMRFIAIQNMDCPENAINLRMKTNLGKTKYMHLKKAMEEEPHAAEAQSKAKTIKDIDFVTTHKWGTILTITIKHKYFKDAGFKLRIQRITKPSVIMTRNVYDSVVSGYLYHKSGRECWLNEYGEPNNEKGVKTNAWLLRVPVEGYSKNLCEILRDEPEEKGLAVYAKFSWKHFIRSAVDVFQTKQKFEILKLCMEDTLRDYDGTIHKIMNFAGYPPSETVYTTTPPIKGHSTTKDAKQRQRLRDTILKIDSNDMDSQLQKAQQLFQCGKQEKSVTKQQKNVTVIAFSNFNYIPVTLHFCSHMKALGYTPVIIATDDKSFESVQKSLCTARRGRDWKRKDGLDALWPMRLQTLLEYVQRNESVFLTDVDTIWRRYESLEQFEDYDIYHGQGTTWPRHAYEKQGWVAAAGIGLWHATAYTESLLRELVKTCGAKCDDQAVLNHYYLDNNIAWSQNDSSLFRNSEHMAIWNKSFVARDTKIHCNAWMDAPFSAKTMEAKIRIFQRSSAQCSDKNEQNKATQLLRKVHLIRIPKAASSTVSAFLRKQQNCEPPGHCCVYPGSPIGSCDVTRTCESIIGCTGHNPRIQLLDDSSTFSVAFFRQPHARYLSAFHYDGHHTPNTGFEEHLLMKKWDNVATKLMLGFHESETIEIDEKMFKRATKNALKLDFAGIVEDIPGEFERLCEKINCIYPTHVPRKARANTQKTQTWSEKSFRLFNRTNRWDIRLYEFVNIWSHRNDATSVKQVTW